MDTVADQLPITPVFIGVYEIVKITTEIGNFLGKNFVVSRKDTQESKAHLRSGGDEKRTRRDVGKEDA